MKYTFMIIVAGILALFSSAMTALGMTNLFAASGMFILILFVVIDLGRFILFNFLVDEWKNLRKIKYLITVILALLFLYSGVGIYAKLDNLVSTSTKQAMTEAAYYNKSEQNASINETRAEDTLLIAKQEYQAAIEWNKNDYENCIQRAQKASDIAEAENKCNNTKRRLDQKASNELKAAQKESKQVLENTEQTIQQNAKNKSEIAAILTTICKFSGKSCTTYDDLQFALTIVIILVIIGTDYLQIAIILAVNTRKNKKEIEKIIKDEIIEQKTAEQEIEIRKEAHPNTENDIILSAAPARMQLTDEPPQLRKKDNSAHDSFRPFLFSGAKPKK